MEEFQMIRWLSEIEDVQKANKIINLHFEEMSVLSHSK
jgi:hypothetical protein